MIGKSFGWHLMWLVHALRPKRNPLRRTRDRVAALMVLLLLLTGLMAVPVVACVGSVIHEAQAKEAATAAASTRPVNAVLTENATIQSQARDSTYPTSQPRADVRWTDPEGRVRVTNVEVAADATTGQSMPLWVDGAGRVVSSPATPSQLRLNVIIVSLLLLSGVEVACAGLIVGVSRLSMACAKPLWEREWSAVEPQWTR
jgi:hypothetical protein